MVPSKMRSDVSPFGGVVSVATRTPDPHVVAERLHRATTVCRIGLHASAARVKAGGVDGEDANDGRDVDDAHEGEV